MNNLKEELIKWLQIQVRRTNTKGLVIGMSGGVDSSVAAVLAKKAFPDNMLGLIMPCFSDEKDREYALFVAKKFDIPVRIIPLSSVFTELFDHLEGKSYIEGEDDLAISNIKPRLRMICLYYFANKLNYLVVGTGNKTEWTIGYFTKYGDGGVDILPLGGLLKTEVLELARELGIPEEIINRTPTAGLWRGQTNEKELGITYKELDRIIQAIESGEKISIPKNIKEKIEKSSHKRNIPPIFSPGKVIY